jgi:hypothetical protein
METQTKQNLIIHNFSTWKKGRLNYIGEINFYKRKNEDLKRSIQIIKEKAKDEIKELKLDMNYNKSQIKKLRNPDLSIQAYEHMVKSHEDFAKGHNMNIIKEEINTPKVWNCGHTENEHCFADTMFCVRDPKWFENYKKEQEEN